KQLDLVVEWRVLTIVERANHIVRGGERFVTVELSARQADEVRGVQSRVLRVDRDKHLHDVIFGQAIENNRRHAEVLAVEPIDVRVERKQPVLTVDGAENAFSLRHFQNADTWIVTG